MCTVYKQCIPCITPGVPGRIFVSWFSEPEYLEKCIVHDWRTKSFLDDSSWEINAKSTQNQRKINAKSTQNQRKINATSRVSPIRWYKRVLDLTSNMVQPIAFGVSFNFNLQSQSHWSLFNGTWQKRPRELENRLRSEIEEMTLQMPVQ